MSSIALYNRMHMADLAFNTCTMNMSQYFHGNGDTKKCPIHVILLYQLNFGLQKQASYHLLILWKCKNQVNIINLPIKHVY